MPCKTAPVKITDLVQRIDSHDFNGWGAEAVGALLGGLIAAAVAFGVARLETNRSKVQVQAEQNRLRIEQEYSRDESERARTRDRQEASEARAAERRVGMESRRLDEFVSVLLAIQDIAPAIDASGPTFEAAHGEIARRIMAWSAYLIDDDELEFEGLFRRCVTDLLKVARLEHEKEDGSTLAFRTTGHEGRRMQDGIFTHGKMWHADPSRHAEATSWFDQNAWKY